MVDCSISGTIGWWCDLFARTHQQLGGRTLDCARNSATYTWYRRLNSKSTAGYKIFSPPTKTAHATARMLGMLCIFVFSVPSKIKCLYPINTGGVRTHSIGCDPTNCYYFAANHLRVFDKDLNGSLGLGELMELFQVGVYVFRG